MSDDQKLVIGVTLGITLFLIGVILLIGHPVKLVGY